MLDLASAGGVEVLLPVAVRAVRQQDGQPIVGGEHEDRCAVRLAGERRPTCSMMPIPGTQPAHIRWIGLVT
jgi:hypothetical protein